MNTIKALKIFLILLLIWWLIDAIGAYSYNLVFLATALASRIAVFVGLWKGLAYVINYPDSQNPNNRFRIIRAVVLIVFSAIIVQIGITSGYWLRNIINSAVADKDILAMAIVNGLGGWYGGIMTALGFALSFGPIYQACKALKFSKPYLTTICIIVPFLLFTIWFWGISVSGNK